MPLIILANGKTYECAFCGLSTFGILFVDIKAKSLAEVLGVFSENGYNFVYHTDIEDRNYTGYVVSGVEFILGGDVVRVSMVKGGATNG